jgi:hypothetical protein
MFWPYHHNQNRSRFEFLIWFKLYWALKTLPWRFFSGRQFWGKTKRDISPHNVDLLTTMNIKTTSRFQQVISSTHGDLISNFRSTSSDWDVKATTGYGSKSGSVNGNFHFQLSNSGWNLFLVWCKDSFCMGLAWGKIESKETQILTSSDTFLPLKHVKPLGILGRSKHGPSFDQTRPPAEYFEWLPGKHVTEGKMLTAQKMQTFNG